MNLFLADDVPLYLWLALGFSVLTFLVSLATLAWVQRYLQALDRIFGEHDQEDPPCGSAS